MKKQTKEKSRDELRDELISVKPIERKKGFKKENISLSHNENIFFKKSRNKIENIYSNLDNISSSTEDKRIIKKIKTSYDKFFKDEVLNSDDMILRQHENLEIDKMNESLHLRYFLYRYKFNIYPKLRKVDKYPPVVQIEPTSICNFRCIMCYQADKTFSNKSEGFMGHMSLDTFKKAIDELDGNIEAITFASRGEPTLNKDFLKMLKYCEDKFLGLKLNTNASMLNEKVINEILSSDLQTIVFSIDEKDKDAYEKIRINGNFDKIIKNLELFNNIRNKNYKRSDKIVRISGVKINDNQNIDAMKKKWGDIADIVAFTNYTPWESSYENPINEITDPCNELWSRMFIWQDGKVNPCDYDYKSLLSKWNIKNQSITNIWNSEEYNYLRYVHLNSLRSKINPCNKCINT